MAYQAVELWVPQGSGHADECTDKQHIDKIRDCVASLLKLAVETVVVDAALGHRSVYGAVHIDSCQHAGG